MLFDNTITIHLCFRRAAQLREEYEKQMNTLKKQHELSVKRLNNEIEKLYSEKHALLAEFDGTNKLNGEKGHKINRSNMSSIHGGDSISVGVLSMSNQNSMHNNNNQQHMRKDDEIPVR